MNDREDPAALREEIRRLRQVIAALSPDLATLLRRRGFRVYKHEPPDDLLLPEAACLDAFYERLKGYSFRLFLRDVIKFQEGFTPEQVSRLAPPPATREYISFLLRSRLAHTVAAGYRLIHRPIRSFGPTLEWFLAETCRREFAAEAIWGVKFKRSGVGGDYDLLAKIDTSLLYMEVKSSPPKQISTNEIKAFFDRIADLRPDFAVFFMDTQLRMKDKIVPMFEEELARRGSDLPVVRMVKELFRAGDRIFIVNAQNGIAANLEKVIIWYFQPVA